MPIKQLRDGRWQVRLCRRINKEAKFWKKTADTKGAAIILENEFKKEAAALKAKASLGITTWEQALQEFELDGKSRYTVSTQYTQMTTLREYTGVWSVMDVRLLTRDQIRQHIAKELEGKSESTKSNLAKYIRAVLMLQESKGRIPINPARGISFGKTKFRKLTAMTRSEVELLLETTKKDQSPWHPVYRIMYELGLRSAEGYALRWEAVDFENNRVKIEEAYCFKSETIKRPKNGTGRVIPINSSLKRFLERLRSENQNSEYVLPRIAGWKHGDAAAILREYQRRLGINETNFHSLRASFITHLLNSGEPITKVQAMVGHADIATTQVYVRLSGSDLDGATDALEISELEEDCHDDEE